MIIHPPESKQANGQFTISSRLEYAQDRGLPDTLWFSVDEGFSSIAANRSDIFLSSLIRTARAIGEDIEVRGELSPKLLYGMREYLRVHASWSGNPYTPEIHAENLLPAERSGPGAASCNISGGVDSFYTLWSQLPENELLPDLQIRYGIFGIGYSSPTHNDNLRAQYVPLLKRRMQSLDVDLIVVDTNANTFSHPSPWWVMSTSRIAIPQLFPSLCSTHFHPSSDMYLHLKPYGSHPMTNHMFSTEATRILTHGAQLFRSEKLLRIKDWDFIHDLLQVCNYTTPNSINDSRCRKCARTTLALDVFGARSKFTTFQPQSKRQGLARRLVVSENMAGDFTFLAQYAREHGRKELLPRILIPLMLYKLTGWIEALFGQKFR